jgi:hypothetical protein
MRSHEEHVRGTHWEIIWNFMGTQQKIYENNKNSTMPPSLERKKKLGFLWVHVTSLHWLQEFSLPTCILSRVMNYEGKFIPSFFFPLCNEPF